MASKYPERTRGSPRSDEVGVLDKISCDNELVQRIPAGRIAVTLLLVTMSWLRGHAVLYHCEIDNQRKTFIKGKWPALGLYNPDEEKEIVELLGKRLVQGLISKGGSVYVLTESDRAPCQVAAGGFHSAILNKRGEVFTFGFGSDGRTGHGDTGNIHRPTLVNEIKAKVQQIGCTWGATFFLADGKMLGCGYNRGSSLGVGHDRAVLTPTLINTGGQQITDFRCSDTLVVTYTESRDVLVWGKCDGGLIIQVPRMEQLEYPRDFFSRGRWNDTGGSVCPAPQIKWRELFKSSEAREDTLQDHLEASRARLHASEKTVKRLEEELKSSKSREDSLQNDLVASGVGMHQVEIKVRYLNDQLESSKAREGALQDDLSVSQAKLREFEKTVKRLDEELESSKAREDSLQDSVAASRASLYELENTVRRLNKELSSSKCHEDSLQDGLAASHARLGEFENTVKRLEEELESSKAGAKSLQHDLTASRVRWRVLLQASKAREDSLQDHLEASRARLREFQKTGKCLVEELKSSKAREKSLQKDLAGSEAMIRELQQKVKKPDQAQRSYMVREESLMDNPTVQSSLMALIMQENAEFFVENLLIDEMLLASLHQSGILTEAHLDELEAKTTGTEKRSAFRKIITQRGSKAPASFLKALLKSEQSQVVEEVLRTRDSKEPNGALHLLAKVKTHFGGDIFKELEAFIPKDEVNDYGSSPRPLKFPPLH